jgi:hypothetical protein
VAAERLVLLIVLVLLPVMEERGGWGTKALTVDMVVVAATSIEKAASNFIVGKEGLEGPVAVKGR